MKVKILQRVDAFYETDAGHYTLFDDEMYLLNETTKDILLFLKKHKEVSFESIFEFIQDQYNSPPQEFKTDIKSFLKKLENEKIISIS